MFYYTGTHRITRIHELLPPPPPPSTPLRIVIDILAFSILLTCLTTQLHSLLVSDRFLLIQPLERKSDKLN